MSSKQKEIQTAENTSKEIWGSYPCKGEYCVSLCITDVYTGWTEVCAHLNKAHTWVPQSVQSFRKTAPFSLQGIDFDNGGEFVNNLLINYCKTNSITYTHSDIVLEEDNHSQEEVDDIAPSLSK